MRHAHRHSHPGRAGRRAARAGMLACTLAMPGAHAASCTAPPWPLWQAFSAGFIQADGRVLDASTPERHTSSEGQSYGMFFALVANDPATFDKLWRWTKNNLAGGDVARQLPSWRWGRNQDGQWGILDRNSASDADMWFAYALLEAGDHWRRDDYLREGRALLARIEREEVADLPGLGPMLLPGREGFAQPGNLWQLNPSYLPLPLLRRFADASPDGPWARIAANSVALLRAASPKGYVADWVSYRAGSPTTGRFVVDPIKGDVGSYDAIRTYLWAGMAPADDPLAAPALGALGGMTGAAAGNGAPPERARAITGQTDGTGPFGFSAALVPYLTARHRPTLADTQRKRAEAQVRDSFAAARSQGTQAPYYDVVLSLFGLGWDEQRYRFLRTGQVQLYWEKTCPPATAR